MYWEHVDWDADTKNSISELKDLSGSLESDLALAMLNQSSSLSWIYPMRLETQFTRLQVSSLFEWPPISLAIILHILKFPVYQALCRSIWSCFVQGNRFESISSLPHAALQFDQHNLLKMLSFLQCAFAAFLSKVRCPLVCGVISQPQFYYIDPCVCF